MYTSIQWSGWWLVKYSYSWWCVNICLDLHCVSYCNRFIEAFTLIVVLSYLHYDDDDDDDDDGDRNHRSILMWSDSNRRGSSAGLEGCVRIFGGKCDFLVNVGACRKYCWTDTDTQFKFPSTLQSNPTPRSTSLSVASAVGCGRLLRLAAHPEPESTSIDIISIIS